VEEDARLQEIEKVVWYRDEFRKNMIDKMKKMKSYADAEVLYMLDGECSVKMLHACNDPQPSAEDLMVGNALDSDLSAASPEISSSEEDASMDSASIVKNDTPNGKVKAESGTASRVHFTRRSTASSADVSAPSPLAGGG
jgi:hypothetical protein